MTRSIGGFFSFDKSLRNFVVASNWRSGSSEKTFVIKSSASCDIISSEATDTDDGNRMLTGASQEVGPSSSESPAEEGRKLRLLLMFSSRFCLLISTCCSSRLRRRSSCFRPPLFLYSATKRERWC